MVDMRDILNLVRTGRLAEATETIQRRLRGSDGPTQPAESSAPMKDVTPRVLTRPSPGAEPAAKQAPPKPKTRGKRVRPKRAAYVRPLRSPRPAFRPAHKGPGTVEARQGALPYRLFVPPVVEDDAPLVVMLHGCSQSPEDFAAGTRMNAAAAAIGAHVIWPEQSRAANANVCWNWFEPGHQGRAGEAAAIVDVVGDVLSEIGSRRSVHAAGLSAGGAMAAILGAHYGDVFHSVGVHSGLPVGSARDVGSAFAAMGSGGRGAIAMAVPSIVFHGDADRTVAFANGTALLPGATEVRSEEVGGRSVTISEARVPGTSVPSELWRVEGLGHAWSGGDTSGSYADPDGPDATAEMLRFFRRTAP